MMAGKIALKCVMALPDYNISVLAMLKCVRGPNPSSGFALPFANVANCDGKIIFA